MRLTRRQLLGSAGAAALTAAGAYELVDRLTSAPERPPARSLPPEQHLLDGTALVVDNGVEVVVPPLHHRMVTAELNVEARVSDLRDAQGALDETLRKLERRFPATPAGLGVTVAWGLPYFRRYVPRLADRYLPLECSTLNRQKLA